MEFYAMAMRAMLISILLIVLQNIKFSNLSNKKYG
jgi:hypothetical protein